ncbi:MAG: hypothetical protein QOK14_866, partial [Frankiaceae bacterium]|nr:hypothetical protein [Frankiaceae bacterium]
MRHADGVHRSASCFLAASVLAPALIELQVAVAGR